MPHSPLPALDRFWNSLDPIRRTVDKHLDAWLPDKTLPPRRLHRAMRHSLFAGGKRIRPILTILACRAVGGRLRDALPAACAIECIHTYSLIHDDLPAIDNDDFRRGRPSCHKAFDEATAILAGDALLTIAFEIIARHTKDPRVVHSTTLQLAASAGCVGMVGGQMADILAEGTRPNIARLLFIHPRKTGALIHAAVCSGALAGGATKKQFDALALYGGAFGLAFQITDDILDVTATSKQLGKTAGKDKAAGKLTFPAVFGLQLSREQAAGFTSVARNALKHLGPRADPLRRLADFILARSS